MNTGLDQYMDIFKDAVEDSAAKLTKSFEKILIEVIILGKFSIEVQKFEGFQAL